MRGILLCFAALALILTSSANAQDEQPSVTYSQEELEQMLAPVALYPDNLLSQVLVASTYPLEVVQADRWISANKELKGEALKSAAQQQPWDESIKGLVATPDVLRAMSEKLEWTQKLGDAVLAQQDDVMKAVQDLRGRAYAEKTLQSNEQQTVEVQQETGDNIIIIESTNPQTVYVPYYNPTVVYGAWPYPYYPPVYYPQPVYYPIASAFAMGIGFAAGAAIWDDVWDSDCDWDGGDIDVEINNNFERNINRGDRERGDRASRQENRQNRRSNWEHKPEHRRGVQYNDRKTQQKFAGNTAGQAQRRQNAEFRGRDNSALDAHRARSSKDMQQALNNNNSQAAERLRQQQKTNNSNLNNRQQTRQARDQSQSRPRSNSRQNASRGNMSDAFSGLDSGRATQRQTNRGSDSFSRSSRGGGRGGGGRGGRGGGGRGGGGRGGGRR